MARLEELTRGAQVKGILPGAVVRVVDVQWHGAVAIERASKDATNAHVNRALLPYEYPNALREPLQRSEHFVQARPFE